MARIADAELERLKTDVSVERLVEAAGVVLTKSNKDRLGRCPFHEDGEPSLVVTPGKNLWHCFGCGIGGGPVDWVMKMHGVGFRQAVDLLRGDLALPSPAPARESAPRTCPAPVALDAEDQALLNQTAAYYHETLKQAPEALDYLKARGIDHPEAIERFKLGFANRTLGSTLPIKQVKAGAEIRGRLGKVGLIRETGHEHFAGSLVIPVMDEAGNVVEAYGRKIQDNQRKGTPLHLYLPGPHKGVWNVEALKESKEVILCEALIDALTFWCHGFQNVTAAYGVEGFTADHLDAFERYGTERVLIAYDRDDAGDRAAEKLAQKLMAKGIGCYRIQFPKGMDANAYARKVQPGPKSLGLLIRTARWMGGGDPPGRLPEMKTAEEKAAQEALEADPEPARTPFPAAAPVQEALDPEDAVLPASPEAQDRVSEEKAAKGETAKASPARKELEADPEPVSLPLPSLAAASEAIQPQAPPLAAALIPGSRASGPGTPEPGAVTPLSSPTPTGDVPHEIQGQDLLMTLEARHYRVRGWQKPLNPETLKVNLMVTQGPRFHVDTLDLYQAKARVAFIRQACMELTESEDALKQDLGKVLRKVEALQADQLAGALAEKERHPAMSEAEHAEALALLKAPDLMTRILRDFEALGVVGEEPNKLTGYLAAVSRLLDRPLALMIQSASAAGKSSLMDAVLDLVPEEDVIRYSAMSGQSLFYMGDRALQHKILAIAEEEGAKQASYALKLLQSEGRVTMASTGKDPATGMLTTHDYTVEGPVMLFLTTTAIDLDEELLNRCLVLTVNESRDQTRAIHALQRQRETLEGLLAKTRRAQLLTLHRNAQRLLQPMAVVNPYAGQLSFRDDQTRSRRDHVKYLTLIRSIALLHQFQRPARVHGDLHYIEVIPSDIELANDLAREVLGRTVDELLPQTRKLLTLLHGWVKAECEARGLPQADFHFTRREAREALGWGDTQLWTHLGRLVEMEFLLPHRGRGKTVEYELLHHGEDAEGRAKLLGLIDGERFRLVTATEEIRGRASHIRGEAPEIRGGEGEYSGEIRGVFGANSGGVREGGIPSKAAPSMALIQMDTPEGGRRGTCQPLGGVPSYVNGVAR